MKRARKREKKRGKAEPLAEVPASVRRYWDRYERNQRNLLQAVKTHMPELKDWASTNIESMWGYEDGIYRFYHHSFKVEGLKGPVKQAIDLFHGIRPGKLNPDYEAIARAGTTEDARRSDIVAAFLHTKYFVEMMIRYGTELEKAPHVLPSGWASVLYLFNMR